ncbi:alpha-2-macroglobulin [Bacteroides sp. 51]|uniref:alpha-2-macroglobulin family protein n=1 Tax=Bacteroides sp. 51 TaxID=2302938 RepID=UPI0013CFEBDF|nr:MG2 domain-containing protein [Bacteroides sp. 51]NDV81488.1 alpha-2-macroglobulin [Bacteroides sp. 51]
MVHTNKTRSVITLLALILALSLNSCKQTNTEIVPSSKFAAYVNAFTGGVISQTSAIRIELTKDLPVVELNSEISGKPITFSPSLKGKAYWVSNNTIEFVPEEGELQPGKLYQATFKLGDYMEVEKELRKFQFTFRVMERNFAIDMKSLFVHASDPEVITIKGEIRFSDVIDTKKIDKMITVRTSDKQNLTVSIEETDSPTVFGFTIADVKKGNQDETVYIEINGKPLGIDNVITKEVKIPAKDRFTFMGANLIKEPENGIQVIFSEPLATPQNLKGLIEVEGVKTTHQISDNVVNVYFEKTQSELKLNVFTGVKSASGKKLEENSNMVFSQEAIKPKVELVTKGTILPDSKNLILPFRAVSLRAVDLSVVRIYESNVLSFLQVNSLGSSSELRRSGRLVCKKMLRLDEDPGKDITRWEDYSVDLSELIQQEPGAIYRIMLSFKQEYSAYPCSGEATDASSDNTFMTRLTLAEEEDETVWDTPRSYYEMEYDGYDWEEYDWAERDNPCDPSYYMNTSRKVTCNLLATNIGVIIKRNSANKLWVAVSNILDTAPMANVEMTVYNYQLQPIGTARTDQDGFAVIDSKGVPFVVVASDGKQKTYVKVADGTENSTSRFDVGGKEIKKGLKGFIYGERGVWRPGDTLHVSFILEDHEKRIPDKHPVSIELFNPRGQFYDKQVSTNGLNGFYAFHIPTKQDDPTGTWNAYVKVGGTSFHKSLRIETVKPNRLKINIELPDKTIKAGEGDVQAVLSSSWLTGAVASNLKAKVEMKLSKVYTQFKSYDNYIFNDPATDFAASDIQVFDGTLNGEGNASLTIKVPEASNAPGMLRANITTRVFEPGGDASINTMSVPFSPFESYVGINLNQPKNRYIETDQDHIFDIVTVNTDGKPVNRTDLEYKIYRVNWSWWWDRRSESFKSYVNNTSITPAAQGTLKTINGKAQFSFRINYPDWGRYLVYVKDKESGHATGGTIYIDWPESRGRSKKTDPSGITMLSFSLDKETYEVGETVTAIIPASSDGRALVAIENGSSVMHREWIQVSSKEDTKYQFTVSSKMAPNVYLHISLLQPHAQTINDLPIRMYGVMPVFVNNKLTILEPQIKMNDVLRPEQEFTVTVSEKSGRPMTYTVAIVDDGLLDLTNFKTPDPWNEFYAREALGIRTWDMFDEVIGAYTGSFGSLFSTGGDEMLKGSDAKANRFRPVVKYLGPFSLKKGSSNTHKVQLPMYVGSVRTMVVAGEDGAYGNAEKTTPVRSPLMILSTLPRVMSINEEIWLPVNVFAMENSVKDVTVSVETSQNVKLVDGNQKKVTFTQTGDKLVYFKVKTGFTTGVETIKVKASGSGHSTYETIEIDVRNPNPAVTLSDSKVLTPNGSEELSYNLSNNSKDNWVNFEVSRIPSVDFSRRFDYLTHYEHYCTEQITSKAFPLLFVATFKEIDKVEQDRIKKNVQEAIRQLYSRQQSNGSFIYWPGYSSINEWVTTYAGTFLLMAQEKGYDVNENVISKWRAYQRSVAQSWTPISRTSTWYYWQSDLQQAYRLYSLALAGTPELGAMNRMKEVKDLSVQALWRLAAAYAINGKTNIANEIVFNAQTTVKPYSSNNSVYGSYDRDEAMILETLVLLGKDKEALLQAKKVSENLSRQYYFSTQSTAYSLLAMGRLAEKFAGSIDIDWSLNGSKQPSVKSARVMYQTSIPTTPLSGKVSVKNNGTGAIYVDLISRTKLVNDTLPEIANNLRMTVRYTDMKGGNIQIDKLKQGTDFMAILKIENISGAFDYQDIALTHIVPSGWEIYNEGLFGGNAGMNASTYNYDYRDIRDDRVLTYFSLNRNQSKEFRVRLQSTYAGAFTLPAIHCEAMYEPTVQARTKAGHVTVER